MALKPRSEAQIKQQIEMSRAGGKASTEKKRSERIHVAAFVCCSGVRTWSEVAGCFRTRNSRLVMDRLIKHANRQAIKSVRELGGTWEQVFDMIVLEDDRLRQEAL